MKRSITSDNYNYSFMLIVDIVECIVERQKMSEFITFTMYVH